MDRGLVFTSKHLNDGFVSYKRGAFVFSRCELMDWSGVDYCDVFIRLSFWRHPFTAEDLLLRHWCNATFLQIWWRNKLIYILDGLRLRTVSVKFHFWLNYSFKKVNRTNVFDLLHFWNISSSYISNTATTGHTESFQHAIYDAWNLHLFFNFEYAWVKEN